jgi:hypothetical protein
MPGIKPDVTDTMIFPMPTHERLGTDSADDLQYRRKPSIQLDKEPTVVVGELNAAMHLTPQDDQLIVGAPREAVSGGRF